MWPSKINRYWHWFLAFVGWMLSPATWWNDAFVNIPIAYGMASVVAWIWPKSFLGAFVASYWLTNFLGSWLLFVGGRGLIKPAVKQPRPWLVVTCTVLYCLIMSALIWKDIVRPISLPHHER